MVVAAQAGRLGASAAVTGQLLTPQEVAELLSVPVSWVYKRTERGASDPIPHLKLGKYLRFEREAVEAWLGERAAA